MKNIRKEISIWIQLGSFIAIWAFLLFISGAEFKINWEALKKLPDVITIYIVFSLIFTKWAWRWSIFKGWLVPIPDIQGTWAGTLKSTWIDPETGQAVPPKNITLVIKQTFSSISCLLYTNESESYSTTAQINEDDESGTFRLSYNYTNRSRAEVRNRSAIHDGAAILKIFLKPELELKGEYWTSRKTTGDMSLRLKSKELTHGFTESA